MMQALLKQFAGSSGANEVINTLAGQGLSRDEAEKAVSATAEGAAAQLGDGSVGGMLGGLLGGGGGALGMLGGLMGGGGGGGAMGMLGGLVGGGAPASTGLPPELMATIARFVADKTGLSPDKAQLAVSLVLPKVIDFVKAKA